MKRIRKLHMWMGTFFAPAIIFFAFTGMLQVLGMHEGEDGAEPPAWIVKLAAIHKDQRWVSEIRRRPGPPPGEARAPGPGPQQQQQVQPQPGPSRPHNRPPSQPLKFFFLLMSLGLITSTGLGLYMSFKLDRNRTLLGGLLAAGTLLPVVLLFL